MTVEKNIAYVPSISGMDQWKGKNRRKLAEELLVQVGLDPILAGRYPRTLSGGQRQRVGIARALAARPEILLMDEPFGALDEMTREQMNMELLEIWEKTGKTIIFITHNIEEAVLLSSRVYVMGTNPGRLVETVTLDLPRPRNLSMITQKKFIEYRQLLESYIGEIDLSKIK